MTIELRHVETNARLSEETPCYSADLFWNGTKVANVANHGHGGPDMVRVIDKAGFDEAVAFVKALPKVPTGYEGIPDLDMDLELWCHMEVGKVEDRKEILKMLRKDLRTSVVFLKDGKLWWTKFKGVRKIEPKHLAHFRKTNPEATVILNDLTEAAAYEIYATRVLQQSS